MWAFVDIGAQWVYDADSDIQPMKIMASDMCQIVTNLQHVGDSCGSIHDMLHVSCVVFGAPASK